LAAAVGGVVGHCCTDNIPVTKDESQRILKAADIVTMARTAVERDYQGEIIDAHAPEMPTRFAKQLTQIVRGGVAVGMTRWRAMQLAIRCARDSIPPLRLAILLDIAVNPLSRPGDTRARINKPWRTVKREMEGLHMLGLLVCDEETVEREGKDKTKWLYSLNPDLDCATLLDMAGKGPNLFEIYAATLHEIEIDEERRERRAALDAQAEIDRQAHEAFQQAQAEKQAQAEERQSKIGAPKF
jgi:hypothetical protein